MDILLKGVTIIDPSSPFHLQAKDIFVSGGKIRTIESEIDKAADHTIDGRALHVSPGWVDIFSDFGDPGFEFRETLETGAAAAAAGGYTDVFVLPHTNPVLQTGSACSYIIEKGRGLMVNFYPVGAVTKNTEGKELTEMYDMGESGAVAFSDGYRPLQTAGVLLKALQYVMATGKTIIQLPDDGSINPHGLMNEGTVSTRLGLPGKPAIAEELMIARDIELVRYTGSKIHFTGVSTAKGLKCIRNAKKEGLPVSCSVTPHHLTFSDEDLWAYDTHLKVAPPLRLPSDRAALMAAVLDGTVDCIASHHTPQDTDSKIVEFEYARQGMIGLQTAFAAVRTAIPDLSPASLAALFHFNPARIFGLEQKRIGVDEEARLTLFSMDAAWSFESNANHSRSGNSAFFGRALKGKPLGIINKDKLFLNQL